MGKSKVVLGLRKASDFSREERIVIIEEYLQTGCLKKDIWHKYTGQLSEHGVLLNWMRDLGYNPKSRSIQSRGINEPEERLTQKVMAKSKQTSAALSELNELKEKYAQLERALVQSELRATAFETMIEVAEKELKISIRKKSYTKQSIR